MKNRNKPVTAADFIAQQRSDPSFIAQKQEFEKKRQALIAQHQAVELPIINDLKDAGFTIESLDELRRSGNPYKEAVPILLRWLPDISNIGVKRSIVRTLSVPWAKRIAARPLITEFRATSEDSASGLKWALGNALEVVSDDDVFDEIAGLVRDRRHGKSREMLAVALGNMKNPAAVNVLIELLHDDEIAGHALMGLGKLKAQKARPYIERFLNHPKPWVRKEATKALAKLNK